MYKKITHTIVEEHFDHPEALRMKSQMGMPWNWNCTTTTTPPPAPMLVNTDAAAQLVAAAHKLLGNYVHRVRTLILSALDSGEDATVIEERLTKDTAAIGTVVSAYYGEPAGTEASLYLKKIALDVFDIARAVKAGTNFNDLKANLMRDIDFFATLLQGANPTHWPAMAVYDILSKAVDYWMTQIQARNRKQWAEDIAATDYVDNIFIGPGSTDFARIFAEGIINQFPEKFGTVSPL